MKEVVPAAVVVRRLLPAPPSAAYDEWIDPEAFGAWMCPRPAVATKVDLEPRVDGLVRIEIEDSGRRFVVFGRYLDLDRPHSLSFTWSCSDWPDPTVESIVTVTFEPHGAGGTLMTIHHTALPGEVRIEHEQGWVAVARQLEDALRRAAGSS